MTINITTANTAGSNSLNTAAIKELFRLIHLTLTKKR